MRKGMLYNMYLFFLDFLHFKITFVLAKKNDVEIQKRIWIFN